MPTGPATTGTRPTRAARWTRTTRPRSDGALQRLGIELIAAYSPEARGRSERMFGTLQKRLPQELRLAGITGIDEANRFLKEVYLPPTQRPLRHPGRGPGHRLRPLRRRARRHPVHPRGPHRRLTTTPCATSAWHFRSPPTATAATTSRPRSGCTSIPTARSPSSTDPDAWPATRPAGAHRHLNPAGRVIRFDATGQSPVDKWTAAPRLTTSPQAQQPQPKRSTHLVHKPVSSECSRQSAQRVGGREPRAAQ